MDPTLHQHHIYHYFEVDAPQEKVFSAISDPKELVNWWPLKCSGEPKLGATYNFNFTDAYDWYGEVSKVIQNRNFHIKMTKSDEDWKHTTFGFNLDTKNGKTAVNFFHVNWEHCNTHFKTASFCWALLLNGLKNYLEKGIIIPFEERS